MFIQRKKFVKKILSLVAMSLLAGCSFNVYTSDGCLLFPKIPVSTDDKAVLKQSTISYEFVSAVANHNEIHQQICNKPKFYEVWK